MDKSTGGPLTSDFVFPAFVLGLRTSPTPPWNFPTPSRVQYPYADKQRVKRNGRP